MNLHFTTNESEELYNSSHCKVHAMSILSVCDIEPAIHLAREEQKVHVVRGHEERLVAGDEVANKGGKLVELIFRKSLAFESHRVVRLWESACQGHGVVPAFIDTLDQDLEGFGSTYSQYFRGRNNEL